MISKQVPTIAVASNNITTSIGLLVGDEFIINKINLFLFITKTEKYFLFFLNK